MLRIDPERGNRIFEPGELPGTQAVVAAALRVWSEYGAKSAWMASHYHDRYRIAFDLFSDGRLAREPCLVDFALSDPVLEPVIEYLGTIPVLRRIGLGLSLPFDEPREPFGSQLYHLDREDSRQIKLYVRVEDTDAAMGPFTHLGAAATRHVLRAATPVAATPGALSFCDEDVERSAGERPSRLLGPAGGGAFIDTSRCLHFGSRVASGRRRLMLAFVYQRYHLIEETPFNWFCIERAGADRVRRLILTPPRPCPPDWFFPDPLLAPGPGARGRAREPVSG